MDPSNLSAQQVEGRQAFVRACQESLDRGRLGAFLGHTEAEYLHIESRAFQMYAQGRHDKASILLEGLLALDAHRAYPALLLGEVRLNQARYAEALELFMKAERLEPEDPTALSKVGEASLRLGQLARAAEFFGRVLSLAPKEHASRRRAEVLMAIAEGHGQRGG